MKLAPANKMAHLLAVLIILVPARYSFAADDGKTFFAELDSTIQNQPSRALSKKELIVERYLRMLARLTIFGLYCDEGNKIGYSTRVSVLQRASVRLEKWSKEVLGSKGAYNRFEKYRNQESLRYVQGDRVRTCELGSPQFHFFTTMNPKDFRLYLSNPPLGSL